MNDVRREKRTLIHKTQSNLLSLLARPSCNQDSKLRTSGSALPYSFAWNGFVMEPRISSRSPVIDFDTLGVRVYRGISGQVYREKSRTSSTVTLLSEYPCGRTNLLTIPLSMLDKFFTEVN